MRAAIWTILGAAAMALAGTASVADEIGPAIERWQAGVICPGEFGQGRNAANDLGFIAQTQVVPAVLGIGFGVKAQAVPDEGIGGVTITVTHPPMGAAGTTQQSYQGGLSGQGFSGFYYRFEEPSEVLPGAWRITAQAGGVLLYDIVFDVVEARPGDGLLRACGIG